MSIKVLVVEDDREIRGLLRTALCAEGFEVLTAVSVSEATALLLHDPPDLVVLDLGLPDGDGAELVRAAGRVVTHRQLLADVWGAEHVLDTHYLRLYMAQLRAKLEAVPSEPRHLLTETGVGYRLVVD